MSSTKLLVSYGVFCGVMTALSRILPAIPDPLVPLFNALQALNVVTYLPNSPALYAYASTQGTAATGANALPTLPEVTVIA